MNTYYKHACLVLVAAGTLSLAAPQVHSETAAIGPSLEFVAITRGAGASNLLFALREDGAFFWMNFIDGTYWQYLESAPGDGYVSLVEYGETSQSWWALRGDGAVYEFNQQHWRLVGQLPTDSAIQSEATGFGSLKSKF